MVTTIAIWLMYGGILLFLAKLGRREDHLLPGKVAVAVQALAYVATYVSAVALVGFAGLCHRMGLQMLFIAAGNVWLGTWFVYKYLAWPTKLWQRKLNARTPAQLLSVGFDSRLLRPFLGILSCILLIVYTSAVFKGAALMLAEAIPLTMLPNLVILVGLVGMALMVGGLRGVLYTEAFQGGLMAAGVAALLIALFVKIGGPIDSVKALAAVEPTQFANNGFTSLSSGRWGLFIISLTLVTSIGVWAQPQLIQRHFALSSKSGARKAAPFAMIVLALVLGGAYFAGGLSRLVLPEVGSPDAVMPALVSALLPEMGKQLFVLAIVSASLSTASALLHIAAGAIGEDVLKVKLKGWKWIVAVLPCVVACGVFAMTSSQIIALLCTTSWTLLASAILIPYLMLVLFGRRNGAQAWTASLVGLGSALGWYMLGYASTATGISGMCAPGILGALHPFMIGIPASMAGWFLGALIPVPAKEPFAEEAAGPD